MAGVGGMGGIHIVRIHGFCENMYFGTVNAKAEGRAELDDSGAARYECVDDMEGMRVEPTRQGGEKCWF